MKYIISGYYGFNNAGDELILHSILSEIRTRDKNAEFTVLSNDPKNTSTIFDVKAISRWNPLQIVKSILCSEILISGGGGLFQDDTSSITLYYYLSHIFIAKVFRKKVFVYGAGISELKKVNSFIAAKFLKLPDFITVRNLESRKLLIGWGIKSEKIEITADPVFLHYSSFKDLKNEKPNIALVIRNPKKNWSIKYFADIADYLIERLSAKIVFIPFHLDQDLSATKKVQKIMKNNSEIIICKKYSELLNSFKNIDLVISQRLHGLILSSLYGIPMIGISNNSKLLRFLDELGLKPLPQYPEPSRDYVEKEITNLWEKRNDFRDNIKSKLDILYSRSKMNTELLFKNLNLS